MSGRKGAAELAGHDSARTGRLGVICVDRIVTEELGWIFREQPTADYGIDAQVEICEGGRPTGRLIAVQIKSGSSWFARGDAEGFTYTGSLRHLDYWLEHSLPVILVLCDPAERRAYWTPVERGHVRRGGSSWSIRVPRVSELSELSAEELRRLARPGRMDGAAAVKLLRSEGGAERLLGALAEARCLVRAASPFLDEAMLWALKALSARGVELRLVTRGEQPELERELLLLGRESPRFELRLCPDMYEKLIILDDAVAVYGTANLTAESWRHGCERMESHDSPEAVARIAARFERLWKCSEPVSNS